MMTIDFNECRTQDLGVSVPNLGMNVPMWHEQCIARIVFSEQIQRTVWFIHSFTTPVPRPAGTPPSMIRRTSAPPTRKN